METDQTFLMPMWTRSWVHKVSTHVGDTNAAVQARVDQSSPTQNDMTYLDELRPQVNGAQPVS